MKRSLSTSLGRLIGLLGYAYGAEAQGNGIDPFAPTAINAGQSSTTYQATVTLSPPSNYTVRLWVYKNGVQKHLSSTIVPNPGMSPATFSKIVNMSGWEPSAGDTILFKATLIVAGKGYPAQDWSVTVGSTRPTTSVSPSRTGAAPVGGSKLRFREEKVGV
jgi:hypothetical protein